MSLVGSWFISSSFLHLLSTITQAFLFLYMFVEHNTGVLPMLRCLLQLLKARKTGISLGVHSILSISIIMLSIYTIFEIIILYLSLIDCNLLKGAAIHCYFLCFP